MGQQTLTRLRRGPPLRAGSITIVPIERSDVTVGHDGGRLRGQGAKRPAAFIIVDAHGSRALDDAGVAIDLSALMQRLGEADVRTAVNEAGEARQNWVVRATGEAYAADTRDRGEVQQCPSRPAGL
jgi:hypothetical protein